MYIFLYLRQNLMKYERYSFVHLCRFIIAKRVFQMLHYETIHPDTLELLRKIQSLEMFKDARLVGGVVFHRVCPSVYAISDTRASG